MPAGVAAVAVAPKKAGSRLPYYQLLTALDKRVDKLNHVRDPVARLRQGAELMTGLLSFAEELWGRMWSIRGALGLEERPE